MPPFEEEPDGSSRSAAGQEVIPGGPESNWPPAPVGKPFPLTFRPCGPKVAKRGESTPFFTLQP
jgi:hypothetical protein